MNWLKGLAVLGVLVGALLVGLPTGFMQGGANLAPEGVEGETYYAPFPVTMTLDGEFRDWDGIPQVNIGQGVGRPAITFAAAADDEFLYLYGNVIDDNIISGEHGSDYWNEDSIEFYLNGTGDLELRSYQDGVAQITLPALNREHEPEAALVAGVRGTTVGARVVTVETETGWAVEVAIPLKNDVWEIVPEQDGVIGFQVHLNAASELNRDTKLSWSVKDPGDQSYQNPSLFGQMIFYEASTPVAPAGEYHFASKLQEDGTLDDFENGIWLGQDRDGNILGLVPQSDEIALAIRQVTSTSALAIPDQDGYPNNVLSVTAEASGQFVHAFTDGFQPTPQDWSAYNALGLWLYGAGNPVQLDMLAVDGQVWSYTVEEVGDTWQHVVVPFALFTSDSAAEPDLTSVAGYGVTLSDSETVYIDDVKLYTVENSSTALNSDSAPETTFILDSTVNWDSREWELVWSDEFDGEAGTAIDDANWTCEVGGHGWGNDELQYYTTSTDNAAMDGEGNLVITAIADSPENGTCWYGACAFTSARCITSDKVEFTYGRVEARMQIPEGQGLWGAFWMLGSNFFEIGWPFSGEIDIMENIGREPQTVYGTIHGPGYSGSSGIGGSQLIDSKFADDFHVFAIDWDPNVIRWYVDGELYSTVSVNNLRNREWVFNHDFFVILNVAVGGSWPGFPDDSTEFPQTMTVDYVRVYQLASQ